MRLSLPRVALVLALMASGCGMESVPRYAGYTARFNAVESVTETVASNRSETPVREDQSAPAFAGDRMAAFPEGEATAPEVPANVARKIIYNADLSLVVEDFDSTQEQITRLVESSGGYIADLNVSGSPGARRSATWKVRIPVSGFESFLQAVIGLGELETNRRTSQDVTEEFFDLEARIKNKQVEEERLIEILQETTGKLEEVLQVEKELSRVREEIERLQGRLRLLADLTSLTTVTIQVRERESFTPPPPVAPNFNTQVSRAFRDSLKDLRDLGEGVVIFFAGWGLWIPLIVLGVIVGLWIARLLLSGFFRLIRRAWVAARLPGRSD